MLTTKNGYKRDIYCCIFYCIHSIGLYVLSIGNEACHITVWMIVKTVLTVTFSSYGNRQISTPHKIDTPELINKKSRHSWLRPREDPYTKFGTNPPNEGFCANGWNITKNYFYLYLFSQVRVQVRPVDEFLCSIALQRRKITQGCAFLGSERCAPKFWG